MAKSDDLQGPNHYGKEAANPRGRAAAAGGFRSGFAVPITRRGKVLGVLEFFSRRHLDRERDMADREVRRSRQKLSMVLGKVNDIVVLAAVEGSDRFRIEEVNDMLLASSKFPRELLEGRLIDEVLAGPVLEQWKEKAAEAVRTRAVSRAEWENSRPAPGRILESRWTPILDENECCTHVLLVSRDVTALRHKEEELRQAHKMESVGRLAGGIAHDFNNLLTVVNGYSEMVLDREDLEPSVRSVLMEIQTSGRRAAALTRQLLAFSRKQILALKPLALDDVVDNMESLIRRAVGETGKVATQRRTGLRKALLDAGQMDHSPQSRLERAGRHALRRHPHHRDGQRRHGRMRGDGRDVRSLGPAFDFRHRGGYDGGCEGPAVRAFLHDQAWGRRPERPWAMRREARGRPFSWWRTRTASAASSGRSWRDADTR